MGSSWGDPAGEPEPGAEPGGFDDLDDLDDVVELADDAALPGDGPNTATSERETIGGDADGDDGGLAARIGRLPRAVRVAGAFAVAAALALAVWPTSRQRETIPQPIPTPSHVNPDLYKVRFEAASLEAKADTDHAVLGLELTNDAATKLEVVSAELWDAVGTRLGSAAQWPAEDLTAQSTTSVPVTLPYACGGGYLPVLPLTIRYSVSTPQNPSVQREYTDSLEDTLWTSYTREQAIRCSGPGDGLSPSAIDTAQPIGAPSDPQGFDLTFTMDAAGATTWRVEKVSAESPDVTLTASALPVAVTPGQTARITTHWHLTDCSPQSSWQNTAGVRFTARRTGANPDPGVPAEEEFQVELRPGLLEEMVQMACGT